MTNKIYTALVSPFYNDGFDEESFVSLLKSQQQAGVDGWVINGTTAESPTLEWSEVERAVALAKQHKKTEEIIIGCGSNSTKKTIALANKAEALGADALLLVVPYYNKPNQRGMLEHFTSIHNNTNTNIILYNIPGRSVVNMQAQTSAQLSKLDRIVAIKDATGDLSFLKQQQEACEKDFLFYSGDDGTYMDFMALGGNGCISVLSHIIGAEMLALTKEVQQDSKAAVLKYKKYLKLCDLLFQEPNPSPVKYALKKMGIIRSDEVRLPLVTIEDSLKASIDAELADLGLI